MSVSRKTYFGSTCRSSTAMPRSVSGSVKVLVDLEYFIGASLCDVRQGIYLHIWLLFILPLESLHLCFKYLETSDIQTAKLALAQ